MEIRLNPPGRQTETVRRVSPVWTVLGLTAVENEDLVVSPGQSDGDRQTGIPGSDRLKQILFIFTPKSF